MSVSGKMDMKKTDIAIIGAGPYGLSLAAHLRSSGREYRIFGDPMLTWRERMPKGMRLKSEGFASNLYDPGKTLTLGRYCADNGILFADIGLPVELETFTRYGLAFQSRFVPNVENRTVTGLRRLPDGFELTFADGGAVVARRVVVAVGISHFAWLPPVLDGLPSDLVTHSSRHHALDKFAGRDVAVIGAGASAIDIAALLHGVGANATLVARIPKLEFHHPPDRNRSIKQRLRWPSTGLGNGWMSYFCVALPRAFRYLPDATRLDIVRAHLGPAPCWFTKAEVEGKVALRLGCSLEKVVPEGDRVRLHLLGPDGAQEELVVDHAIAGTGYRVDLRRIAFISKDLRGDIASIEQTPRLSSHFESSIPGLYFLGALSANTFGPLTRFAYGAGFAAKRTMAGLMAVR
jgi:hypothetical protein